MSSRSFAVAMTGASGAIYGLRLVDALTEAGHLVHLMISGPARRVLKHEEGLDISDPPDLAMLFQYPDLIRYHHGKAVEATPASGSADIEAVVLCPCSMGTLGSIAAGTSANLIERAADVMMKEGRPLVLVPRETPLSLVHLRNMTSLAEAGAVILPAAPGFYHGPKTIDDLVGHVVTKITDRLGLRLDLIERWGGG